VYAYQGAIDDLAESLMKSNTFSPDKEAGRTNWDNLVAFAESASERVQDAWRDKGKGAATALQQSFRRTLAGMLIDSGHTSREAWRLVNQVMEEPHQVNLEIGEINTAKLDHKLAELRQQRADIRTQFVVPEGATEKEAQRILAEQSAALKPINAQIKATIDKRSQEKGKGELDDTANPDGKPRAAHINAKVDPDSIATANAQLDGIIKLRRSRIVVEVVPPSTGPTSGPTAGPSVGLTAGPTSLAGAAGTVLGSPLTTGTGGAAASGTSSGHQVTHLGPSKTPVAVYLDGVEIASRIEARRALARTESVRRAP
jgi:predicted transglutaminase-like cysteine proteinase